VLVSGDPQGKLGALFKRLDAVNKSNGPFDYLFCVGSFFPPAGELGEMQALRDSRPHFACAFSDRSLRARLEPRSTRRCHNVDGVPPEACSAVAAQQLRHTLLVRHDNTRDADNMTLI